MTLILTRSVEVMILRDQNVLVVARYSLKVISIINKRVQF